MSSNARSRKQQMKPADPQAFGTGITQQITEVRNGFHKVLQMLICSESNQPNSQKITTKCKDTNLLSIPGALKCWMMEEQLWEVPLYVFLVLYCFQVSILLIVEKKYMRIGIRRIFGGT